MWHIALNISRGNWFKRISRLRSPVTKLLGGRFLLTVASAIAALVHWIGSHEHSSIGGIHGKIGFVMLAIAIGHTFKRFKFYKSR